MLRKTSPARRLGIHFLRADLRANAPDWTALDFRAPRLDFRDAMPRDFRDTTRDDFLDPALLDFLDPADLRAPAVFLRTSPESRREAMNRVIADMSCFERPCCRASSSELGGSGGASIISNGRAGMRLRAIVACGADGGLSGLVVPKVVGAARFARGCNAASPRRAGPGTDQGVMRTNSRQIGWSANITSTRYTPDAGGMGSFQYVSRS